MHRQQAGPEHSLPTPLLLHGAPGSPYTRKMLALLRYRGIGYRLIVNPAAWPTSLPEPKVRLLPTFYLPGPTGDLEAVVDSTPLLRRFERQLPGRAALPEDPVLAFVDALIEDYADEWLTKAMFHYRWAYRPDIEKAAAILPRWRGITAGEETIARLSEEFAERQISRLWVVGSNATTAPVIEASYRRFLEIFDALLQQQPFLLGARPAACDFAAYGQLSQLAKFDPTPMALTLEVAPRVFAWCDLVDDLSGLELAPAAEESDRDGWLQRSALRPRLGPLLAEIGRVYAPFLIANAAALDSGAEQVETTIDARPWVQKPFPYQGKCLVWLRESYATLDGADREAVDALLEGTGCEALFA
ncbi:MAG: glutathione S-transferase [Acidobacteria bacterium]|nr:MAG: glutathione S-transferase [Acidobacteriota bacterium]REK03774.1 MAG: glutathione S-transferase [Acidobacteriota bacterium]